MFCDDAALEVNLARGVNLDLSTRATLATTSSLGILVPDISVCLLHRLGNKWKTVAELDSRVAIDIYKSPKDRKERASRQQAFIRTEDEPTKRIWYMYAAGDDGSTGHHVNNLYVPRPRADTDSKSQTVKNKARVDQQVTRNRIQNIRIATNRLYPPRIKVRSDARGSPNRP